MCTFIKGLKKKIETFFRQKSDLEIYLKGSKTLVEIEQRQREYMSNTFNRYY